MLKHILGVGGVVFIASLPAPAAAQSFTPCPDAASKPALAGSLCLTAQVPLDGMESDGSGPNIDLFVRKFPASDQRRRRGEVWLIAGGPGESGASFYPVLPALRRAFRDYDLVIPDHRGTGYSTKLCPKEEDPASPDGISLAGSEWGLCLGTLQADPARARARARAFTITNAARDLSRLVARYRGRGNLYLYGVSYGTQLVLRTMLVAPVPVDGIILDGLVPPEGDPRWDLSRRTQVVDVVGRACLTPAQIEQYRALLARKDASWSKEVPGGDLRRFLASLLTFPELRNRIPGIIDGLLRNDTTPLKEAKDGLRVRVAGLNAYPQSPPSLPLVMLISGSENNERRNLTAQIVAREAEGALFTSPIPGLLVDPPVPLYNRDRFFGQVPAKLPRTLVVHGTLDPNTAYEGAQVNVAALRATGGDVKLVTVKGAAHFLPLVAPDCFVRAASAFVESREVATRCALMPSQVKMR